MRPATLAVEVPPWAMAGGGAASPIASSTPTRQLHVRRRDIISPLRVVRVQESAKDVAGLGLLDHGLGVVRQQKAFLLQCGGGFRDRGHVVVMRSIALF